MQKKQPKPMRKKAAKSRGNAAKGTLAKPAVTPKLEPGESVEQLNARVRQGQRQLAIFREVGRSLTLGVSLAKTLDVLTVQAVEFFRADAVACMLWDERFSQMERRAGCGFRTEYSLNEPIPRELLKPYLDDGRDYLTIPNLRMSPFKNMRAIESEGFVSALGVTLAINGMVLGILIIYSRGHVRNFTLEEIENARLFASEAAIAVNNVQLLTELKDEVKIANTLLKVAEDIGTLGSIDEVLNRIVTTITRVMHFHVCAVFLWEKEKHFFMPVKATGLPPHRSPFFRTLLLRSQDLAFTEEELNQRSVVFAREYPQRFPLEKLAGVLGHRDLVFVPLVIKQQLLGAVVAGGHSAPQSFGHKDVMFLRGIAAQAAIAIDDANLFGELENSFWETIQSLAAAIEAKDQYTHDHSKAVIQYGVQLAEELQLSLRDMELIRKACMLHDVGKIGVEDQILRKETPLTHAERGEIEKHPVIGQEIIASVRGLTEVSHIIRHHHERYDGQGYPDHLKGENIPLLARILQIADSFDAMTSDRPYRKALSQEQAVAELKKHAGQQFDPELVERFIRILQREGFRQNSNWS